MHEKIVRIDIAVKVIKKSFFIFMSVIMVNKYIHFMESDNSLLTKFGLLHVPIVIGSMIARLHDKYGILPPTHIKITLF